MRSIKCRRSVVWSAVLCGLVSLLIVNQHITAQEEKSASKPATQKSQRAKPRGRLPSFFAAVVTDEQRSKVYELQARYNEDINELRSKIEELISQRDREIDAVLSKEQLASVNKMREEAAKRRQARISKTSQ